MSIIFERYLMLFIQYSGYSQFKFVAPLMNFHIISYLVPMYASIKTNHQSIIFQSCSIVKLKSLSRSIYTIKKHFICNRGRPSFIIHSSVLSHWPCILPCTHRSCTGRRRSRTSTPCRDHERRATTEAAATVTSSTCSTPATWTWCCR